MEDGEGVALRGARANKLMKSSQRARLKELFHLALERSPEDRSMFLLEMCHEDGELRAELERLLAAHAQAGNFIEQSPVSERPSTALTGRVIGRYEVGRLIGAGGMGEVYRARDTKLGREVALKILPEQFATGPDSLARFKREAQILASLNHPNIATIYGFEDADGVQALALELVDGPTLADRVAQGRIPPGEALLIAKQIAEALEAAHEHGIVHRDLKPSNIKLTRDGIVKVLDFGLAKAIETAADGHDTSPVPTITGSVKTHAGMILGTAGYMSPEQAKASTVDHRSDIFSFGCVLYEMLAGHRAFQGDTITEVLASVLKSEADWRSLPPQLSPGIQDLLRRCLEKDPRHRWHAAADVRIQIEELVQKGVASKQPSTAALRPLWKRAIPVVLSAIVAGALAGTAAWYLRPTAVTPLPVTRLPLILPDGQTLTAPANTHVVALSPDGTQAVYAANARLYLRSMSELDARAIGGTEGYQAVDESRLFTGWPIARVLCRVGSHAQESCGDGRCARDDLPGRPPVRYQLGARRHRLRPGQQGDHAGLAEWRHTGRARARQGR